MFQVNRGPAQKSTATAKIPKDRQVRLERRGEQRQGWSEEEEGR